MVVKKIDTLIDAFLPNHKSPVNRLIKLLLEYGKGDFQKLAKCAEACALDEEANKNWYMAGLYWETKAKVYKFTKETERECEALHLLAHTYVETAEGSLKQPNGFAVAAHHLQSAIEVLRRIPDCKKTSKAKLGRRNMLITRKNQPMS